MSTFKTQALKDAAIEKQQEVVDNAQPHASAEAKAKLEDLKAATVTG